MAIPVERLADPAPFSVKALRDEVVSDDELFPRRGDQGVAQVAINRFLELLDREGYEVV